MTIQVPHAKGPWAWVATHVRAFMPYTLDQFISSESMPVGYSDKNYELWHFTDRQFLLLSRRVNRRLPLYWHFRHYLHIKLPYPSLIGTPMEIEWRLQKPPKKSGK